MIKPHLIISSAITIIYSSSLLAQEMPAEFRSFQLKKLSLETGNKWEEKTIFGPIEFDHNSVISDSLKTEARFGTMLFNNKKMLYAFGHFTFKKNYHGYLYPRVVDFPEKFNRFSGISRDISRGGFYAGETDISGISFQNNWMTLQFGRGRQSWGAGNDIQICLSENSNSYDYGLLDLDFGKLRVRYFHGYLETDSLAHNRYITGRGIEWNNENNLLLGLSEVIIYSGKNRPIDFAYFNPISTHLELELNDRQNNLGTGNGNGVWQLSFDYKPFNKFRFAGNYLFDEFTLDKQQTNAGKGSGRAFSLKSTYSIINDRESILIFYLTHISVGTNTFKHQNGNNNFVQREKPLGWVTGSDSKESKIGFSGTHNKAFILNLEYGMKEIGENNILTNPYGGYTEYLAGPFPSGLVENVSFGFARFQWWMSSYFSVIAEIKHSSSNKLGKNFEWIFGFDIFYGVNKYL